MVGNAVSGFVDGFFKGRDWRDKQEDRKHDRARQERLDKLDLERHELDMSRYADANRRANEAHGVRMDESAHSKSERERAIRRRDEEEAFLRTMADGLGATRPGQDTAATDDRFPIGVDADTAPAAAPTQPRAPVPVQPRLGFGATRAAPPPQNDMMAGGGEDDAMAGGLMLRPAGVEDRLEDTPPDTNVAPGGQASFTITEVDPNASAYRQDRQALERKRDISRALNTIGLDLVQNRDASPVSRGLGAVTDYFTLNKTKGAENSQSRSAASQAHDWYSSRDAQEFFETNPNLLAEAAKDPVAFFQSKDGTVPEELRDSVSSALSGNGGGRDAAAARTPGASVPEREAAASIDTAERVALSFGLKPGENFTTKQVERGSKAYVDRYYDTIVPQMIEFYTARGELDKAQAYIELVESREGKAALKGIGKATFKVVNGDYDGAANEMLGAFKAYGIADPSMEVDEDATGIVRDERGQPIGGKVVFVDPKTGNKFEKTFATPDEFIEYGHLMVNPATVAEMLAAKRTPPKGAMSQKDIVDAATEIVKADVSGQTTFDQALGQVMQSLGSLGVSTGANPQQVDPPLYRPGQ